MSLLAHGAQTARSEIVRRRRAAAMLTWAAKEWATLRKAAACGESGRSAVTGRPSSLLSRMSGASGTSPKNGTSSSCAARCAPP